MKDNGNEVGCSESERHRESLSKLSKERGFLQYPGRRRKMLLCEGRLAPEENNWRSVCRAHTSAEETVLMSYKGEQMSGLKLQVCKRA